MKIDVIEKDNLQQRTNIEHFIMQQSISFKPCPSIFENQITFTDSEKTRRHDGQHDSSVSCELSLEERSEIELLYKGIHVATHLPKRLDNTCYIKA